MILIVVSSNYLLTVGVDGIWYESMIEFSLLEDDNIVATSLFYGLEKQTNKNILGFDGDTSAELSPTFIHSTSMKNMGISRLKRKHTGELHHFQIQLDFHAVTALLLGSGDKNILEGVIQIAGRMQQYFMVYQIDYIHVGGVTREAGICHHFLISAVAYLLLQCCATLSIMPSTFIMLLLGVRRGLAWDFWIDTHGSVSKSCRGGISWCVFLVFQWGSQSLSLGVYTRIYLC